MMFQQGGTTPSSGASTACSQSADGTVFAIWDARSCPAPRTLSGRDIVYELRRRFVCGKKEEIVIFCNVSQSKSDASLHVEDPSVLTRVTNDDVLQEQLRCELQKKLDSAETISRLIFICGDEDFSDLILKIRDEKNTRVILLYNDKATPPFRRVADESIPFSTLLDKLPESSVTGTEPSEVPIEVPLSRKEPSLASTQSLFPLSGLKGFHSDHPSSVSATDLVEASKHQKDYKVNVDETSRADETEEMQVEVIRPNGEKVVQTRHTWLCEEDGNIHKAQEKESLEESSFCRLVTSPKSGSSFEIASHAKDLGGPVLFILPSEMDVHLCKMYARHQSELGSVTSWLAYGQRIHHDSALMFTTASMFFKEFKNWDGNAMNFRTIIVDGLHEDSIYQRAVLRLLAGNVEVDPGPFLFLWSKNRDVIDSMKAKFLLYSETTIEDDYASSVSTISKNPTSNLTVTCVDTVFEFLEEIKTDKTLLEATHIRPPTHGVETPGGGDVLVLLPTIKQAYEANEIFAARLRKADAEEKECRILHAVILDDSLLPLKTSKPRDSAWRVVFASSVPEMVAGMMDIRCVVDSGLISTTAFEGGFFFREYAYVSELETEQRKKLAGLRGSGTCYRLYTESELLTELPASANNLRYAEDVVLRVTADESSASLSFMQELPKAQLEEAKCALQNIGAVDNKGQLTDLGKNLCKTSLEPRLGKIIFDSQRKIPLRDAILLSLLAFEDLSTAYKALNSGNLDAHHLQRGQCVFSIIIELYKEWWTRKGKFRHLWCEKFSLNHAFFQFLWLQFTCIKPEFAIPRECENGGISIGSTVEASFPNNVLRATKQGYQHPTLDYTVAVSPTSLFVPQTESGTAVVCCLFNREKGKKELELLNACTLSRCNGASTQADTEGNSALVQTQFGPIGSLIWQSHSGSFGSHSIPDVENAPEGETVLDIARQIVVISGTAEYCRLACSKFQRIVDDEVTKLAKQDMEAVLCTAESPYGARPVFAVIGFGGLTSEVLSPAAFRTIITDEITNTTKEFCEKANRSKTPVEWTFLSELGSFQTTFKTADEANAAYRSMDHKDSKLAVPRQALEFRKQLTDRRPALQRLFLGIDKITDSSLDQVCVAKTPSTLAQHFDPHGEELNCKICENRTHRLQVYTQKKGVQKTLDSSGVERDDCDSDSVTKHDMLKHHLHLLQYGIAKIAGDEGLKCTPEITTDFLKHESIRIYLDFSRSATASAPSKMRERSFCFVLINGCHQTILEAKTCLEESFTFPRDFFLTVRGGFEEELQKLNKKDPEESISYSYAPDDRLVYLKLHGNSDRNLAAAVKHLNALTHGTKLPMEGGLLCIEEAKAIIPKIEGPKVYIHCKATQLHVTGDSSEVHRFLCRHQTLMMEGKRKKKLDLIWEDFSTLRAFLKTFGDDVGRFARECKLHAAVFSENFESVEIVGTNAAVIKAEGSVLELPRADLKHDSYTSEECCPVCRLPPGKPSGRVAACGAHRLESCGHLHCMPCLMVAVRFAALPLTCFRKDCRRKWVVADITHVTNGKPELLSELARRSLLHAITADTTGRWLLCPTPECQFVWDTESSAESQGIQIFEDVHICPGCTNPVCFRCCCLFHYGFSCEEFIASKSSFQENSFATAPSQPLDDPCSNPGPSTSTSISVSPQATGRAREHNKSARKLSTSSRPRLVVAQAKDFMSGDKIYPMTRNPRGLCIIINNIYFFHDPPRLGAKVDGENMKNLFEALHFLVDYREDLTAHDMKKMFREAAKTKAHRNAECFVVILMSHGTNGKIKGVDGEDVDLLYDVFRRFNNVNCPDLQGKPKIFFIQACRGDEYDNGTKGVRDTQDGCDMFGRIPTWTDMYFAYATTPGYVALKNQQIGSWFLSAVYEVFSKNACNLHLHELMDSVADKVTTRSAHDGSKQSPDMTARGWRKKLYFNPGYYL